MLVYLFYANALEEVHGGTELLIDAADKQPGTTVYHVLDIGAMYMNFAVKEGEDGYDVRDFGGQNLWAHANYTPKLDYGEIHGGNVFHGGFHVIECGSDQHWMVFNE